VNHVDFDTIVRMAQHEPHMAVIVRRHLDAWADGYEQALLALRRDLVNAPRAVIGLMDEHLAEFREDRLDLAAKRLKEQQSESERLALISLWLLTQTKGEGT